MHPRIYLIRHGETEWSLASRHTGRTDIPLTEQGEQEARRLGERLRDLRFSQVFTSPRQRARRTCELAGLGPGPKSNRTWRSGTMAITRDRTLWTFARGGPTGISFGTAVRAVKCPPKFPTALTGSSPGSARWTGTSRFLARPFWVRPGRAVDRVAGDRRAAFPAWHGVAQHFWVRTQPPRGAAHRDVEFGLSFRTRDDARCAVPASRWPAFRKEFCQALM